MQEYYQQLVQLFTQEQTAWTMQIFIVVFVTLIASFVANRVLTKFEKKLSATKTPWDDALVHSLRRPLRVFIWIVGLAFAVNIIHHESQAAIFEAVRPIKNVGIILCVAWFVLRFIKEAENNILLQAEAEGKEVDRSTADAIAKLLRVSVIITAFLITLQTLGFSISTVLAFGGMGGIAIGFAAKDLLSNFFGAIMIYLDRPFAIGDWIRSPDKNIEGTVEAIGWRQTRIRTFDKRPIYVPNSVFSTIVVENPSRMTHRRIYETIGVRYDDMSKADQIVKDVEAMLQKHKEIDTKETLMVNLNAFNESSVDFFIYTFTKTTNWEKFHEVKQDVLLKINDIIEKQGAEIAFPTTTVHIPENVSFSAPELAGLAKGKK